MIVTMTCVMCRKPGEVEVPEEGYRRWQEGMYVQNAFPGLSVDQREMLISGMHPECFDAVFPPEED